MTTLLLLGPVATSIRGVATTPSASATIASLGGVGRHPRTLPSKLSITMRRLLAVEGRHPRSTTTSSLPLGGGGGRHPRPRVLVSLRGRHPRLRMGIIAHIIIKGKSIRVSRGGREGRHPRSRLLVSSTILVLISEASRGGRHPRPRVLSSDTTTD